VSKHKHHIIPVYHCKELGIDPDFDENIVEVDRLDHARIHWGYKCDDLEPLFEYITPAQWIIDLIPRGDNRDVGAAVITAKGELDEIDMSGENNPMYGKTHSPETLKKLSDRIGDKNPMWKGGIKVNDPVAYQKEYDKKREKTPERIAYMKAYRATPDRIAYMKALEQTPERKAYKKAYRARKKAETQGEGTLEAFLR